MLFYIDYLDHITSGKYTFNHLAMRLRFDLLIFAGNDTLCMSVPACVKLADTTKLLMQLDLFWKENRIVLQLDKKHKENANNYFANRKRVLSKGMTEEKLLSHFEYVAYEDNRTNTFFNVYLPEVVSVASADLFIGKELDTDGLFRAETVKMFERHYDSICSTLDINQAINFTGIVNRINSLAVENTSLFQRAVIEDLIKEEYMPTTVEQLAIATLLDRSFALANAFTSNAIPLSLVTNQLTGKWLIHLLSRSYRKLFVLICRLSWSDVFFLSQDEDWRHFLSYINAYIFITQEIVRTDQDRQIDTCIKRISHSISLFSLLCLAKEEALGATKSILYNNGLFSEAQNIDLMVDLLEESYAGRYRRLLSILYAIDLSANRIEEKLTKDKRFSYILEIGRHQKEKTYELLN